MILNFINTSNGGKGLIKIIVISGILLMFAFSCRAHKTDRNKKIIEYNAIADSSNFKSDPIENKCSNQICSTFVHLKNSHTIFVAAFPRAPDKQTLSSKLVSISLSCGNPCNYSTFVDLETGKISRPFFLVLAVDTTNETVSYCDSIFVLISPIFNTAVAPIRLLRPFSPSATPFTVVDSAFFRSNRFVFRYLKGKDYYEVWDSVEVTNTR